MIQMRILRSLYDGVWADLARPHAFAAERVGFLYVRGVAAGLGLALLAFDYLSVKDSDYLHDPYVGAKFGSAAIRNALQRALDLRAGCFHIHAHSLGFPAEFSRTDMESNRRLIPSFTSLVPGQPHGAIVLAESSFCGTLWRSGSEHGYPIDKMTVVGYPLRLMRYPHEPE